MELTSGFLIYAAAFRLAVIAAGGVGLARRCPRGRTAERMTDTGTILLAVGDTDVLTAATASIATLSNIGPGLSAVGPAGNFGFFDPWQKLLMVFLMLLGRLEFFAVLALLRAQFWRR